MNKYVTWADLDFSKPNSNDTISDVKKNVQKSKSLTCFDSQKPQKKEFGWQLVIWAQYNRSKLVTIQWVIQYTKNSYLESKVMQKLQKFNAKYDTTLRIPIPNQK